MERQVSAFLARPIRQMIGRAGLSKRESATTQDESGRRSSVLKVLARRADAVPPVRDATRLLASVACWKLFYGELSGTMEHVSCSCTDLA
jgi:hypothetical protein